MSIFERLSEKDRDLMEKYINRYAYTDMDIADNSTKAPLSYIMRFWELGKADLFQMFGEQFIISRPVFFSTPTPDLEHELTHQMREGGKMYPFWKAIHDLRVVGESSPLYYISRTYSRLFYDVISGWTLAENVYSGSTFELPCPDGKTIRFEAGCKPVKMLGKVAKAYNLEGFEEFRLEHSRILNQKKLEGTMCLSIHPLDYMTMSDNESDWTSCMSWADCGCYRRGTLEMMSSPYVVVAYLKAKNDMGLDFKDIDNLEATWNNKKWRSLYIVDSHLMTSIKGYPYTNHEFDKFVLDWLKELKTDIQYGEPTIWDACGGVQFKSARDEDPIINVRFETNDMYNDFGTEEHMGVFTDGLPTYNPKDGRDWRNTIVINYSGPAVCVHCGAVDNFECEEDELCCSDCYHGIRCTHCNNPTDESYELDGEYYCEYCYHDLREVCAITGEVHHEDNMADLYLVPDILFTEGCELTKSMFNNGSFVSTRVFRDFVYDSVLFERYANTSSCFNPGAQLYTVKVGPWNTKYFVKMSEMTSQGMLTLFDVDSSEIDDMLAQLEEDLWPKD